MLCLNARFLQAVSSCTQWKSQMSNNIQVYGLHLVTLAAISEDSQIDFATGNVAFERLGVWGFYTRMFLKFWQQSIFQVEKLPEKLCQQGKFYR